MVVFATWEMAIEELYCTTWRRPPPSTSDISRGMWTKRRENLLAAAMGAGMPIWIIGHSIERRKGARA